MQTDTTFKTNIVTLGMKRLYESPLWYVEFPNGGTETPSFLFTSDFPSLL